MILNLIFKKPKTFWIIAIGIFLSYIIVGVGVYLWQSSIVKEAKRNTTTVLAELSQEKMSIEKEATALQKETKSNLEKFKNNEVDFTTAKVGDKLANGMVVKEVIGQHGLIFGGSTVISGNYNYYPNNDSEYPYTAGLVCFTPEQSLILPNTGVGNGEFCFANQDVAKNRYGPIGSHGRATVVIDNFALGLEGVNSADLIKTIELIKK